MKKALTVLLGAVIATNVFALSVTLKTKKGSDPLRYQFPNGVNIGPKCSGNYKLKEKELHRISGKTGSVIVRNQNGVIAHCGTITFSGQITIVAKIKGSLSNSSSSCSLSAHS